MKPTNIKSKPREFRGYRNFELRDSDMEQNNGVGQTIEDDTYTIKELLERFTRGQIPNIQKQGVYDDEPDHESEDLSSLVRKDIHEQHTYVVDTFNKQKQSIEKLKSHSKKYKESEESPTPAEPEQLEEPKKDTRGTEGAAKRSKSAPLVSDPGDD